MKLEIVQKAYIVWHEGMIGYPPEQFRSIDDIDVTYAKTPGEAKCYGKSEAYDYELYGEDPSFIDLKVKRAKHADRIRFEDKIVNRYYVQELLERRKRIEKRRKQVMKHPEDALFYIQRGYVGNSMLFWGLGSAGYTCKLNQSQKYTRVEVLKRFLDGNPDDRIWPADHIEANTCVVVDGQHVSGKLVI